jgi:hypothetical protein
VCLWHVSHPSDAYTQYLRNLLQSPQRQLLTVVCCGWETEPHRSCDTHGSPRALDGRKKICTRTLWPQSLPFLLICSHGHEDRWGGVAGAWAVPQAFSLCGVKSHLGELEALGFSRSPIIIRFLNWPSETGVYLIRRTKQTSC